MSQTFQHFLNSAGKYPLLTKDQELMLGRQIKAWQEIKDIENPTPEQKRIIRNGKRAYEKFFKSNLRLVISVAKKYAHLCTFHSIDDLIQEGCFGLSRAIEKFDYSRGYKFSTYAYWWVRQAITRSMSQQENHIRLPVTCVEALSKVRKWIPGFVLEHKRFPSVEEMAEHSGVSLDSMKAYLPHILGVISLDIKVNSGDKNSHDLIDIIPAPIDSPLEAVEATDAREVVSQLFPKLKSREQHIINLHWGLNNDAPVSLRDISEDLGISRESARQCEKTAMKKMRRFAAHLRIAEAAA